MPRYDVFLSHNSADKPAVELLAQRLRTETGLVPFLDKWHLIPGEPWQEALEQALAESATVAVFIGPSGVSPWHNEEMRSALDNTVRSRDEYRFIPVLLPGAREPEMTSFLGRRVWVDFRSGLDDTEAFERLVAGIKGEAIAGGAYALPDEPAPYRGLLPFEADQARFFFGREADYRALIEKLKRYSFVAVIGASGSGKSSLVRAGLLPRLKSQESLDSRQWRSLIFTPGSQPLRALAEQLATFGPATDRLRLADELTDRLSRRADGLRTAITTLLADHPQPVLLVVDQFEELFTMCRGSSAHCRSLVEQFVTNLAEAAGGSDNRIRVLITLRADFLDRCLALASLRDLLQDRQFLLGPLSEGSLREAMARPAQEVGAFFEKGLINTIMRDVSPEPGILPLLQHALYELWRARRGPWLTLEAYEASGGVSGALRRRAQATYDALTPDQKRLARSIFLRLTALGEGASDTRRRAARAELYPAGVDPAQVESVLHALSSEQARLIVADEQTVEVTHEALIQQWDTLHEWLEADREALRTHRHLTRAAQEWARLGRDPGELYRGARLAQAREWAETQANELNELEQAFLKASLAEQERLAQEREAQRQRDLEAAQKLARAEEQRAEEAEARAREQAQATARLRRRNLGLVAFGFMALLFALAAGIFAALSNMSANTARSAQATAEAERERAELQANLAFSRQLAAQAQSLADQNPETAMLLAIEAQRAAQTDEATDIMAKLPYIYPPIATRLHGHTGRVVDIAWSPDGVYLASKSNDGNVIIWEPESGQSNTLRDPRLNDVLGGGLLTMANMMGTHGLAWNPIGRQLASASVEETILIWSPVVSQPLAILKSPGPVSGLAWRPDGSQLAAASRDGTVNIWLLSALLGSSNAAHLNLEGHAENVESVAWSPDGSYLASASSDQTIIIWDTNSGRVLTRLQGHTGSVVSVAWRPDGRQLASASADQTIIIWDVNLGQPAVTLRDYSRGIKNVAWSPDGRQLASASDDNTVVVWDIATAQPVTTLRGHTGGVTSLAWHPDGDRLASGSGDSTIIVWDLTIGPPATRLDASGRIFSLAWSADNRQIAAASSDDIVTLWDVTSLQETAVLTGHSHFVEHLAWSPDDIYLAAASQDNGVTVWNVASGRARQLYDRSGGVSEMSWSPDGQQLTTTLFDGSVVVWSLVTGQRTTVLATDLTKSQSELTLSPDGNRFASALEDNRIIISEAKTRQTLDILTSFTKTIWDLTWSPAGDQLAAAGDDGQIMIWETVSGQVTSLAGKTDTVWQMAWSPDGSRLASASSDKTVTVWDVASGKSLFRLEGHASTVWDVAWSPDGSRLASASNDQMVMVWDSGNGRRIATLEGHAKEVRSVAWSPDGGNLASGAGDGVIIIWDVANRQAGATLQGHSGAVRALVWSPDGARLASAADDLAILVWDVTQRTYRTLQYGSNSILSLSWSADGGQLTAGLFDGARLVWDVASGQRAATLVSRIDDSSFQVWQPGGSQLATVAADNTILIWDEAQPGSTRQPFRRLESQAGLTANLIWSPNGDYLASALVDDPVPIIWNVEAGQPTLLQGQAESSNIMAWSPDSTWLATASAGIVRVWEATSGEAQPIVPRPEGRSDIWAIAWSPDGAYVAIDSGDLLASNDVVVLLKSRFIQLPCHLASRNLSRQEWKQYLGNRPYRAICDNLPLDQTK
jgi:WD40 repeat protein